jgi:lysophospholipase L1-like esterase
MKLPKKALLGIGVVILIAALTLMVLVFDGLGNRTISHGSVLVACAGDSITEGSGYPSELQNLLGSNYIVRNFGVSGASVMVESGKPYVNLTAFQDAENFLPEIVVIMLGTNDARSYSLPHIGNFVSEYENLISVFQGLTSKPEIFLVRPPPVFNNSLGLNGTIFVQDVIPRIEQVATDLRLPLIDVYSVLISHSAYFPDGVHPNGEGAEIIATVVNNGITSIDSTRAIALGTAKTECDRNAIKIILEKRS